MSTTQMYLPALDATNGRYSSREALDIGRSIVEHGSGLLEFSHDDIVRQVHCGWIEFLKEPQAYKDFWTFQRDPNDPEGPDDGYVPRNGGRHNLKEFFHFRPGLVDLLASRNVERIKESGIKGKLDFERHEAWLQACTILYHICFSTALSIAGGIDAALKQGTDYRTMIEAHTGGMHVLRLLCYHEELKPGVELGKFHPDRNFMTLHVFETHPGLVLGGKNESQENYVVQPGKILCFMGTKAKIETERAATKLRALVHGVVGRDSGKKQIDTTGDGRRYSMVFFVHTDTVIPQAERKPMEPVTHVKAHALTQPAVQVAA